MKNSVNNQSVANNVVIESIVSNPNGAYKYINRNQLIEHYQDLVALCNKAGLKSAVPADADKLGKRCLVDSYVELAKEYLALVGSSEEPEAVEEVKVEEPVAEEEAPKVKESSKKSEKKAEVKESTEHRGNAEERLAKYSAELAEKEAIENPSKEVRKRIASLKRKIERANKALKA